MSQTQRVTPALVLVLVGLALIWAHLAMAALSVCLNETPDLATGLKNGIPAVPLLAQTLLPLVAPFGSAPTPGGATCDAAGPARATALAGVVYVFGLVLLERAAFSVRLQWLVVGAVAAVSELALFFMPGLWSSDILDYVSHGRVSSIHGANPYVVAPFAFPSDPFSRLGGWAEVVTVYGPLWSRLEGLVTAILADATPVQLAFAFKLIALTSEILSAGLIYWIVRQWSQTGLTRVRPVVAVAMWVWNPLVNVELAGSGHNEGFMIVFVLIAFALLTAAQRVHGVGSAHRLLWPAALVCLWLGALVKFVPAGIEALAALVWLRGASRWTGRIGRVLVLVLLLAAISLVVAWPWLDSPAVAEPLLGLAAGGQRYKDVWQDAVAAYLTVRLVPRLGVPAADAMDVARAIAWGFTRALFVLYLSLEVWFLWQRTRSHPALVARFLASASIRTLLLAILLYVSQVYAWYFLWPLPLACLLGFRDPWSRAVVVFGLTFLPAFYLREFQSYGVFYVPIYALVGLAIVALAWAWERRPRMVVKASSPA